MRCGSARPAAGFGLLAAVACGGGRPPASHDGGDLNASSPRAAARFDAFPPSVRRGILQWIASAKKPETRARRVEETAPLAARDLRANQWRPSS
jgi:bacteriocin resistance YdeI/OmpD-like protein